MWANGLTRDEVNGLLAESFPFEAKTFKGYIQLVGRLRIYGSVPADDRTLASIAGCTKHWWSSRAWPVLREIFEVSEEGRLYHPGIRSVREPVPSSPETPEEEAARAALAARNKANALNGWERRRAAMHVVPREAEPGSHPAPHAASHDLASKSHPESDAKSDTFASVSHAAGEPVASSVASPSHDLASGGSRASPLSQEVRPLQGGQESKEESLRASVDARAGADATGDASHATGDATSHAKPAPSHRLRGAKPGPVIAQIAPDFAPSARSEREATMRGFAAADLLPRFIDHYTGTGEAKADWDAVFRNWVRGEARTVQTRERRQGHIPLPMAGGVTAPALSDADKALRARLMGASRLRGLTSSAPLAPTIERLQEAGEAGIAWLDLMEAWERAGLRGEQPPEFREFVGRNTSRQASA